MPPYSWNRAAVQKMVKPGQQLRYAAGQGYWAGPKIAPRLAPAAQAPLAALIGRLSSQHPTPQQQLGLAQSLVNTSLAAQKAEIEANAKKAQLEAGKQAASARGFALALGGMDKANAQQVRDAYGSAGNDIGKFGTSLAAALGQAQQGQIDSARQTVGAKTGDLVQAVDPSAYANAQNFDAALQASVPNALATQYSLGGVPSDPLNPGNSPIVTPAQARLASLGSQYVSQGLAARSAAGEQEAKLAGTGPGLVRQALQDIQSSGRADDAALIQALYLLQTTDKNAFDKFVQKASLTGKVNGKPTVAAQTAAANAAAKRAAAASAVEKNRIAEINANTARIKAQTAAKNADLAKAAKAGESTKTIRAKYGTNALTYLQTVMGIDPKHLDRGPRKRPPTKAALVRAVYNVHGAPFAGQYGLTAAMMKGWANKVVESFPKAWWSDGYWKKREADAAAASSSAGPLKS